MTSEDFDRLRTVCQKEGFEINVYNHSVKSVFEIKKIDRFEGVEFVNILKIHKVKGMDEMKIYTENGKWFYKALCTPSTEFAYVDQLKKEAFERFGVIKEGDRFDRSWAYEHWPNPAIIDSTKRGYTYDKKHDQLSFNGSVIYEASKWATKLKERVKVEFGWTEKVVAKTITPVGLFTDFKTGKSIFEKMNDKQIGDIFKFLASQLEAYLNGETE